MLQSQKETCCSYALAADAGGGEGKHTESLRVAASFPPSLPLQLERRFPFSSSACLAPPQHCGTHISIWILMVKLQPR